MYNLGNKNQSKIFQWLGGIIPWDHRLIINLKDKIYQSVNSIIKIKNFGYIYFKVGTNWNDKLN